METSAPTTTTTTTTTGIANSSGMILGSGGSEQGSLPGGSIPSSSSCNNNNGSTMNGKVSMLLKVVREGNYEVVESLINNREVGINDSDSSGTALGVAVDTVNMKMMKFLVRRGANVNVTIYGRSILQYCLERNQYALAAYLVRMGAKPKTVTVQTNPNIDIIVNQVIMSQVVKFINALRVHNFQRADYLITKNLKHNILIVDCLDQDRETPLYVLAKNNNADAVDWLIKHGAQVDLKVLDRNMTPLQVSIQSKHLNVIKTLIKNGANIYTRDDFGLTCEERAKHAGIDLNALIYGTGTTQPHFFTPPSYQNNLIINQSVPIQAKVVPPPSYQTNLVINQTPPNQPPPSYTFQQAQTIYQPLNPVGSVPQTYQQVPPNYFLQPQPFVQSIHPPLYNMPNASPQYPPTASVPLSPTVPQVPQYSPPIVNTTPTTPLSSVDPTPQVFQASKVSQLPEVEISTTPTPNFDVGSPPFPTDSLEVHYAGDENREHDFDPEEPKSLEMILKQRYRKMQLIGKGTNGYVYKAKKFNRGKDEAPVIAVKLVDFFSTESLNKSLKSAMNLIKLRHDHIISVRDVSVLKCKLPDTNQNSNDLANKSTLCVEMDYYEKGSLESLIKQKIVLKEAVIKKFISQIVGSLQYMRKHKIVHRNIKPQNILLREWDPSENIDTVLIGFRLSKSVSDSASDIQQAGSLQYIPPELLDISDELEENAVIFASADIFALGVSCYQILSHDTVTMVNGLIMKYGNEELVMNHLRSRITKYQQYPYSAELVDLVISMLRLNTADRITTEEILDRLSSF